MFAIVVNPRGLRAQSRTARSADGHHETLSMDDSDLIIGRLSHFRALGLRVALLRLSMGRNRNRPSDE
jgi:hypothetical protein